jgi:hypothetical protein
MGSYHLRQVHDPGVGLRDHLRVAGHDGGLGALHDRRLA